LAIQPRQYARNTERLLSENCPLSAEAPSRSDCRHGRIVATIRRPASRYLLRRFEACYLVRWPPSFTFWACRCPPRGHQRLAAGPSDRRLFVQLLWQSPAVIALDSVPERGAKSSHAGWTRSEGAAFPPHPGRGGRAQTALRGVCNHERPLAKGNCYGRQSPGTASSADHP